LRPLPAEASPVEVAQQALSRNAIIKILVEIVQELRQPLTVINSAVEIILKGQLGAVSAVQKELLDLALAGGQRIEKIIDALTSISGMPAALHPDADILSFIYQQQ
ncbi:MAG: hypothetical protein HY343_09595, partial [Lentisphaerae bacterium]|nr:hypothetical protein [Lentisphaerota bacterium]